MENLVKYLFELQQLKRTMRSGLTMVGVYPNCSVADHLSVATIMGIILAHLEKANIEKVTLMLIFHDSEEVRSSDINKVTNRYIDHHKIDKIAFFEQMELLPKELASKLKKLYQEFEEGKTLESKVAKDADYLEDAVWCKEWVERGYKGAQDWIDNIKKVLKTESAKKLLSEIEKTDSNCWWRDLKYIPEINRGKSAK